MEAEGGGESGFGVLEKHEERPLGNVGNDGWAAMLRPLVIDSGAAEAVMPADWFGAHAAEESDGSRNGAYYTMADGAPAYAECQKTLKMSRPDGGRAGLMAFQLAKVNKAFGSVSNTVANGNKVAFDARGSYIESSWSGGRIWLCEDNGVCVLDMTVAPPDEPSSTGFARQS